MIRQPKWMFCAFKQRTSMAQCKLLILGSLLLACSSVRGADEPAAIEAIRQAGGLVLKIAADAEDREIAFQLAGEKIGDEQLKHVGDVSHVIWLNLAGTSVTDAGLAEVAKLTRLEKLHLERTKIGDEGLEHLAKLEQLQYLNIYGTNVTDVGLQRLKGLTRLRRLYVWESKVTDAGIATLNSALPDLEIVAGVKLAPPPPPPIPPPPTLQAPPTQETAKAPQ
jgi:hypothetical protein